MGVCFQATEKERTEALKTEVARVADELEAQQDDVNSKIKARFPYASDSCV